MNFWREWISRSTYTGRWRDEVHRSALTLKLLNARWSGSIVAAATFGLPETIGGVRNWDYRYSWIRDASFTLYAGTRLGMTEETGAFVAWLAERFESTRPETLRTLYTIGGGTDLAEQTLDHLEGYRGSRPVRVGNAAFDQLQLDIYGELLDAIYLFDKYRESTSYSLWSRIAALVDWVAENWRQPDDGVWEVRSGRREFLYSRVLCWVAIDRGIRMAVKRSFPAPVARWREARDAIYREVHEEFWDPRLEAFVGVKGTSRLDASCLIMPLVRFISATDPRWLSTMRAVERGLVQDSLVYRYEIDGPEVGRARRAPRGASRSAPSGTSSASPARAICRRRAFSSRRCWATPATSACMRRRSDRRGSIWATTPRPSPIWRSSVRPTIWTGGCRGRAMAPEPASSPPAAGSTRRSRFR